MWGRRREEVVVNFHSMCILLRKMMTFGLAKCTTGVDGHGPRDGGTPILLVAGAATGHLQTNLQIAAAPPGGEREGSCHWSRTNSVKCWPSYRG